ncbi:hypothetical protein P4H66_12480 [Paenibacillus dokdonensis]|uniref:Uncharacterized protein n=1 Tax=Paenibacillus dokdonensis TaxID=2567944 RepID=A0ABU6GLN0_9BACL|nr:hypothetical protein [Paenibacillus dokdonensis]MEC0240664.1 hypothetical protein [Paenibacillus dokdonensis]
MMRIIKTQQNFEVLRSAGTHPSALFDQIEDYFLQLRNELEDENSSEFRLDGCGYIVVLEAGAKFDGLGESG